MIFYLEIKRHIEILEKIDPLLVNCWLQYFIDFIDNDSFYIVELRIVQLYDFIYTN